MKLRNARYLSHDFIDSLLQEGDIAVDATAGNGHDTLYLAQKVGERGHVYAFDVQQAALDSTKERLAENGIPDERVTLILSGHERMADYVKEPVRCVLFNLGWLPSGDHSVTTRVPTTLAAVSSCVLRMISSRVTRPVRTHRAALVPFLPTTLSISQWPGSSRLLMCSGRCSMLSPLGAFAAFTRL